jgi:hypothetical protein
MTRIEVPNTVPRRGALQRIVRGAFVLLLLIIVGAGLWTWLTLSWAYSDGTRAGVLQKYSRRGWLCKTQEGELAQYVVAGISPQIWQFSVRDAKIGAELERAVGARVQLHYTEHPGVPTGCFADTRYFVDHVTVTETENPSGTTPGAAPLPGTAPTPSAAPSAAPNASPAPSPESTPAAPPTTPPPSTTPPNP